MKPFDQWDQDEMKSEMVKRRRTEARPVMDNNQGRKDNAWQDISGVLKKRGQLTAGDVATMTGRNYAAADAMLRHYQKKGLARVVITVDKVKIWELTDLGRDVASGVVAP